jgi:hypothetical protein
MHRPENDL